MAGFGSFAKNLKNSCLCFNNWIATSLFLSLSKVLKFTLSRCQYLDCQEVEVFGFIHNYRIKPYRSLKFTVDFYLAFDLFLLSLHLISSFIYPRCGLAALASSKELDFCVSPRGARVNS